MVATTEHVVGWLAVTVASTTEHKLLAADRAYVVAPVPEPPLEVKLTTIPVELVRTLFVIDSCA